LREKEKGKTKIILHRCILDQDILGLPKISLKIITNSSKATRRGLRWKAFLPLCRRFGLVCTFPMSDCQFRGLRKRGCREEQQQFHRGLVQPSKPKFNRYHKFLKMKILSKLPNGCPSFRLRVQFRKYGQGSLKIRCRKQLPSVQE
jgi:hypothetical protein